MSINLSQKYNAFLIDSKRALCDEKNCYAMTKGKSMFFDDNHLSIFGGREVIKTLDIQGIEQIE